MTTIRVKITRSGVNQGKIIKLDLEEYLRGVVPSEIYASSPYAALCAQSIAARTYGLQKIKVRAKLDYDVYDNTSDQAYNPIKIDFRSDKAVSDTKGLILQYNGNILDTCVYTDANGGKTVSSQQRWGNVRPYLIEKIDQFDAKAGYKKSGHGVGMSQRGAIQAAKDGKTYQEILSFYYPGTKIVSVNNQGNTPETFNVLYKAKINTSKDAGLSLWSDYNRSKALIDVKKNEIIEILDRPTQIGWAYGRYKNVSGYVDSQYLVKTESENPGIKTLYKARINTQYDAGLNLWDSSNKKNSLIQVKKWEIVEVLDYPKSGSFEYVRYNNICGYADTQYLEKI